MTRTEVHRGSFFFHGLILSEDDNCKANIIRDNRNFQPTENKKYLEDGVLNKINATEKQLHIFTREEKGY